MVVALQRVSGASQRKDVWWLFRGEIRASCPKCGYIQTVNDGQRALSCRDCGNRSEITLED